MNKYDSIEALRFFAALAVIAFHLPILGFGEFGVDVFFIISGFVISLSTETETKYFFQKRLVRILPTYYFFTIGVFLLAVMFPPLLNNTKPDIFHLLKSLLFIPFDKNGIGHYPLFYVGWTLNYEIYFYALFAIALKISKKHRTILSTLLISVVFIFGKGFSYFPLQVYSNSIVYEFVIGMAMYEFIVVRRYKYVLIILLIFLISIIFNRISLDERFFYYGIPSTFFICGTIYFFQDRHMPNFLVILGSASYSVYLIHPFVVQIFDKILNFHEFTIYYQFLTSVFCILFINISALFFYNLIELPTIKLLRKFTIKE